MPWMTPRSTSSWDAATVYPVNSLDYDLERCDSIPGYKFMGQPWPAGDRPGARYGACNINADITSALSATTHYCKTLLEACGLKYTGSGPVFILGDPHFNSGDAYAGSVTPVANLDVDVDGTGAAADSWSGNIKNLVGGCSITLVPGMTPTFDFAMVGMIDPNLATVAQTAQVVSAGQWAATTITSPYTGTGGAPRWTPGLDVATTIFPSTTNILEAKISTNPTIAMRKGLGSFAAAGHGYLAPAITGYSPTVEMVVEVPTTISATTDPKARFLTGGTGNLSLTHTFATGNTLTILLTGWKVGAMPQTSERDGILVQSVILVPARTAVVASAMVLTWVFA